MSSQSSPGPPGSGPALPPGLWTIEQIQNMSSDSIRNGKMVSVMGFVKDFQPPIQTKGTDHKCTLEIKDLSIQYMSTGMKVTIFWPLHRMPKVQGPSDAVLIRNAKTQMWSGGVSLLANNISEFHILPSTSIPSSLPQNSRAPWQSFTPSNCRLPTILETAYAIWANSRVSELCLPDAQNFQNRAQQAMNVKQKFSLLKDVKPDSFCDMLGEVVKVYDGSGYVTVYLSDYTANTLLYNHVWGGGGATEARDGDEFGYIKSKPKTDKDWPGPFGKMAIQLTLYDDHADFVRDRKVQPKQWLLLKNVHLKYGRTGGCLEGALRRDRDAFEGKVQVQILEQSDDVEENDVRWKEAVRRKFAWWEKFEKQKRHILGETTGLGDKRKRVDEIVNKNSKQRRDEHRAAVKKRVGETEAKVVKKLNLNEHIRCNHPDQSPVPLHVILKRRTAHLDSESRQEVALPFDVCRYRANVRVVDYFPDKVEDFAVGRRITEYDMLSDYSGGEDTDIEADRRTFKSGKGFAKKYEWRFALEVKDADPTSRGERVWLLVDNHSAQMLLNIDATNLRGNQDTLRAVKEQLCVVWGNLEEHKSALLRQKSLEVMKSSPPPSLEPESSDPQPWRKTGEQPGLDSDDEDETSRKALGELGTLNSTTNEDTSLSVDAVGNKAFTCCIKQYGAKINEDDPSKANAGDGKRWARIFGLFGTQIL